MKRQIETFLPEDRKQEREQQQVLADCDTQGENLLYRENDPHFTSSALVCNESLDKVLLVHHNLYHTYTWPGGHVDGSADFLAEAIREVKEETGLETVIPISGEILSLDILPTSEQIKKGTVIPAHMHYSVGYGCIASEKDVVCNKPDENSDVCWVPVDAIDDYSNEPHMLRIYKQILLRMKKKMKEKQSLFSKLQGLLLPWYRANARDLPWRRDKEPYHVWLSEIMLQQTRVEAVKGYYQRFLQIFPTIAHLANAEEQELLKCWEGLGYYNRARNLQKAAVCIMEQYNGVFPSKYEDILALPGIGVYTAGAIASICFEQPTPAVDGNVLRVISRVTENFRQIDSAYLKKSVTESLAKIYPAGSCGDFTQALMELGATVCIPNGQPQCEICPLKEICMANKKNTQLLLPVKKKKSPRKVEQKTVFVLQCGEKTAVQQREEPGVLQGLWQFPNVAGICSEEDIGKVLGEWGIATFVPERVVKRKHIFTHIEWEMTCYYVQCNVMPAQFLWVTEEDLERKFTLPTAFKMFLEN